MELVSVVAYPRQTYSHLLPTSAGSSLECIDAGTEVRSLKAT